MTIQTLSQRFDKSYPVAKTIAPQNLGLTDFRNYCNNISEFETLYNTMGQDPRYDGLITFEIESGVLKTCKSLGGSWEWFEIPTLDKVKEEISKQVVGGSVDLSDYYTKSESDNKYATKSHNHSYNDLTNKPTIPSIDGLATETFVTDKIAEASLGGGDNGNVDLGNYQQKTDNLLSTTNKTIVGAINENKSSLDDITLEVFNVTSGLPQLGEYEIYEPTTASNEWVTDSTGKVLNITADEFYGLFYDDFVGTSDYGTVTKTSLGKDQSKQYDLYEYDFKPKNYSRTILLSSGMHPYELSAHFGLAHFIKHVMDSSIQHAGYKYVRENVRIKLIPIINPWGWNQNPKKYHNVNGVNPNRNFGSKHWESNPSGEGNEWEYKGTAPFSEKETQIVRDWVMSNANAKFWIDCHTGLKALSVPADNFIYYLSSDSYKNKILSALNKLENRIKTKYSKSNPIKEVRIDNTGMTRMWWSLENAGVPTMCVEQSPDNTLWGTALNNEGGDITNYEVCLSTYIFEMLKGEVETYSSILDYVRTLERKIVRLESSSQIKPTPTDVYGEIVLSKTSTTIIEGQTDTFTVKLDKAPTNNQVITLSKNNNDVTLNPTTLTFTKDNYDISQTVNITVAEDTDTSNESCVINLSSPNVSNKTINISITDNDSSIVEPVQGLLASVNLANGNVTDTSGNNNNAILSGTYTTDSTGVIFNESDGLIDTGLKLLQNSETEFTLKYSLMLNDISGTTSKYFLSQGDFTETGTLMHTSYGGFCDIKVTNGPNGSNNYFAFGNTQTSEEPKFSLSRSKKYNICLTYDGNTIKYYIDGVLKNTKTIKITLANKNLILGNRIDGIRGMNGKIYSYEIYNKCLSDSDITI